jgi:hypothetical protein
MNTKKTIPCSHFNVHCAAVSSKTLIKITKGTGRMYIITHTFFSISILMTHNRNVEIFFKDKYYKSVLVMVLSLLGKH